VSADAGVRVSPVPSDEEMVAILAAYEALWPRPVVAAPDPAPPRWRFAGRWWSARPRYGGWT
jgi:hypothetical protein